MTERGTPMNISNGPEYMYDVFLSYRHKPLDNRICKKLHTLLETYKPVRRFRTARISRVFRDDEELPAAGILSDTISRALVSSKYLVVVCSPDTPESEWVDREVRTFIELGRSDRIFALLISGTPDQSFPPSLKHVQGIENRILRVKAAGEKQIIRNLKRERLKIIAAVSGVSWDRFRVSHRRRSIRRFILAAAAFMALFCASGFWLLRQWLLAASYNNHALKEELLVHTVVQNVTNSLHERLSMVPEAVPVVAGILEENLIYLESLAAIDTGSAETEGFLGKGYLRTIGAWIKLGDYSRAAKYADKAVEEFERLAASGSGRKEDLLTCYSMAGVCMEYAGNMDKAAAYYRKAISLGKKLDGRDPATDIKKQIAMNLNSLGDCYAAMGRAEDAESCYDDSLEIYLGLLSSGDLSERELAEACGQMASALHDAGAHDQASRYYRQEATYLQSLLEAGSLPDESLHLDLALCYANQGLILLFQGDNRQAAGMLEQASEIFRSASVESNPETDYYHASVLSSLGQACQNMGDYPRAGSCFAEALSILDRYADDTGNLPVRRALADNYRYMGLNAKYTAHPEEAVAWYTRAISLYEWLVNDRKELSQLWGLAVSLHDLGTVYIDDGDYDAAKPLLFRALDMFRAYGEAAGTASAGTNMAICNYNIGLCFYNQTDYHGALPYFLSAAEHYRSGLQKPGAGLKRIFADCFGYLGRCYAYLGEYGKAKDWHQESALVFEELSREQAEYLKSYALSLYWAAIDRILLGDKQAKDYYILCLDRCSKYLENGDSSFRPTYLSLYAFYYLVFGDDYGQALEISRQAWQESQGDVLVTKIYAYSLLFSGYREESSEILSGLAAGNPASLGSIRFDVEVFRASGFSDRELVTITRLLEE